MKKLFAIALVLALSLGCASGALAQEYLGLATGGTAGTYYALGGDIAALWMAKDSNLDVSVQTTGGSKANIVLLANKEAELGTVQNDVAYYAAIGDKDFFDGQAYTNFSAIAALYPEAVQIVVAADSDIKTVADLKGRKVSIGAVGSGVYFNAVQILGQAGLTVEDIEPQYLSFDESSTAFQNRQIEAFFVTAGVPNTAIIEVSTKQAVRLITVTDDQMAALQAQYGFYIPYSVPAGTYTGMEEDVVIPAIGAILIVSNDVSEDVVYSLTKILLEDTNDLTHAKKASITPESAIVGIPAEVGFHPGALKYYVEKGLLAANAQ